MAETSNSPTILKLKATSHFPIKLTPTNFPVWRKQVVSTLIGLDLYKYLDGSHPSPPPFVTITATDKDKASTKSEPNPAYNLWFRQDQMLLSALLGSCEEKIQPIVSSAETSQQAWTRLSASYASSSRSRIISLKSKLSSNPRGNRTITDFLLDMQSIADDLALAQSPVQDEDLLVHILNQLGDEYKATTAALKAWDTPITFPELFDILLDVERSLTPLESAPIPHLTTVNYTTNRNTNQLPTNNSNRNYSNSNNNNRSQRPSSTSTNSQQNNRQQRPYNNYQSRSQQPGNNARTNRPYCNYCRFAGHDTWDCRTLARFLRDNQIMIANSVANNTTHRGQQPTTPWLMDSAASNHFSSDGSSLHQLSDYGGPDEIVLGNGSSYGGAINARTQPQ